MDRDRLALLSLVVFLVGVGGQFGLFWSLILGGLVGLVAVILGAVVDAGRHDE